MILYNKTKQSITIGMGKYAVHIPASDTIGTRGPEVDLSNDPMKRISISQDWKLLLMLIEAGSLEVV